jgi:hypothetical protein
VSEPGLISVRTQVVLDTLVGSIADAVTSRLQDPLDPDVEAALRSTGDPQRARIGYLARAVEVERFERAREPMPWLAEQLQRHRSDGVAWSAAAAAAATELASIEPQQRPDPEDDRAVSWKVPGPGGHVRYYLALRSADGDGGRAGPAARRAWLSGFLIHCIHEAAPPDPR